MVSSPYQANHGFCHLYIEVAFFCLYSFARIRHLPANCDNGLLPKITLVNTVGYQRYT